LNPIALFGGTFDPVHFGHIGLARAAFTQLESSRMILLPAGNPYQKGRMPFASAEHRLNMLRLAFKEDADIEIDDRELRRRGPTYTYDTLVELREQYGNGVSLVWLIGSDAFAGLDSWHRWHELFGLAHFAVIDRSGYQPDLANRSAEFREEVAARLATSGGIRAKSSGAVAPLGIAPRPISSTDIRTRLAAGQSIRGLTPDAVCDYIEQHKLYRPEEKA
jgi:nicotinate-nucleotide adenylyltransferase